MVDKADIIVLGNRDELFAPLAQQAPAGKQVIDLVGFMPRGTQGNAEGICW
ncbi:GDP-mannose 6-dehydrogenase [compost metagenome]